MCKVKSGINLNSETDLQNMVIGIILRQQTKYQENDILKTAKYYSQNANFPIKTITLKRTIRRSLDILVRFEKVNCLDGIYTPLGIDKL